MTVSNAKQALLDQGEDLKNYFGVKSGTTLNATNLAWLKLFKDNNYLDSVNANGCFFITPNEIKNGSGMEPRLMTKFDFGTQLPWIFQQHGLGILSLSRNQYFVGKFNSFVDFPDNSNTPLQTLNFPDDIESINYEELTSESVALNAGFISGAYNNFLGEDRLEHTLSGRMTTDTFDITLNTLGTSVSVKKAQMEIDAGYEGDRSITIVEAKNSLSPDFNSRQLYYPYRRFKDIADKKEVRTVYQVYSDGVFNFYEYAFDNLQDFTSIRLVQNARYTLDTESISQAEVTQIANSVTVEPEPTSHNLPFPQADTFSRVVNACEIISEEGSITKDELCEENGFTHRQADYYTHSGRYIGILQFNSFGAIELTAKGEFIMNAVTPKQRKLLFIKAILKYPVFNQIYLDYLKTGNIPDTSRIVQLMRANGIAYSDVTLERRAVTVKSWISWINSHITR